MASDPASLTCDHCGETFLRREHLDRHLRRHSGIKPFRCEVCDKAFARRDTLLRHSTVHRHGDETRSTPRRCSQACLSCAKLKQRCRGGMPCTRCRETGTECIYGPAKTPGVKTVTSSRSNIIIPATGIGGGTISPGPSNQDPSDAYSQVPGIHVPSGQPHGATQQPASTSTSHHHHGGPISNGQDNLSFSPTAAGHPVPVPPNFTPSSLHSDPTLFTPDHWDSSMSQHGNPIVNDFAAEWDALTAYFPFFPVPEELEDALGTAQDMTNHGQQRGVDTHNNHFQNPHFQGQAAPGPSAVVPDRASGPDTSTQALNSSRLRVEVPCRRFPQTRDTHMLTAEAETFGHVRDVPLRAYEDLQSFYVAQSQDSPSSFVPMRLIQAFVDLYFEHFDPQFPFIHVSLLEAQELPWMLLLATAAIGSYYSELDDIREYTSILCDLLGRAVEREALAQISRPSRALVQSAFLRHIHLMSCGLYKQVSLANHKRQMLMAMCRDMATRREAEKTSQQNPTKSSDEWANWLVIEEETRLVCCIYMYECIYYVFTYTPTDFNLFDVSQQMPGSSRLWYARDAHEWKSKQLEFQAVRLQRGASQEVAPPPDPDCDPFLAKMSLMAMYADVKNNQRQRRASRLAMNTFGSHLKAMSPRIAKAPVRPCFIETDDKAMMDNPLLEQSIEHIALLTSEESARCHATLPHLLGILRTVSVRTLCSGTGWQTETAQMNKLKAEFREFLRRDGARARRCMWHAACISKLLQTTRRLASYDVFTAGIATCFIVLYMELRPAEPQPSARWRVVRLDQLSTWEDVQDWARNGGDANIHLTNVGVMREPDSLVRFLRITEKAMLRQVAWNAYFTAWAKTLVQLRHGEKPTMQCEDYNEGKEGEGRERERPE
ncbi:hypothetical protein MCOR02_000095 [Pyricularia oryzae]|nr:hypothetical protein MCOR02_000095 [Pyricularia oryzae]KAI6504349.1 hypothetical protein MCOR13_004899 [Pyricularia oryzae]